MSRIGILESETLLGKELKAALERRRDLWSRIDLLATDTEDYATVSEIAGEAAIVKSLDDDAVAALDLLFVCPGEGPTPAELAPRLQGAGTVVFLAPGESVPGAATVVDGVNLEAARAGATLVSPVAGAIGLAHLLSPLQPLGLEEAAAWIVQPVSTSGQQGVDELLDQTRRVLAFEPPNPDGFFGRRLAHNLFPGTGAAQLAAGVREVLGSRPRLSVETIRAGVFHAVAISVHARCAPTTELEAVRDALTDHPFVEMAGEPSPPGPAEAAGGDRLLAGEARTDPDTPGGFWLWGVADNLTLGGAANAIAIAEVLLERPN